MCLPWQQELQLSIWDNRQLVFHIAVEEFHPTLCTIVLIQPYWRFFQHHSETFICFWVGFLQRFRGILAGVLQQIIQVHVRRCAFNEMLCQLYTRCNRNKKFRHRFVSLSIQYFYILMGTTNVFLFCFFVFLGNMRLTFSFFFLPLLDFKNYQNPAVFSFCFIFVFAFLQNL